MKNLKYSFMLIASAMMALSGVRIASPRLQSSKKLAISRALTTESSFAISSSSIFYSPTSQEVKDYYSTINVGDAGETLLTKLQAILKTGQKKVAYNSGASNSSTKWFGYTLYERDYSLSPLTQNEVSTGVWKQSGIWVNSLYFNSPVYINSGINDGTFTYYIDWNPATHSGTVTADVDYLSSNRAFDREHVFPKSFGFNGSNDLYQKLTAGCDAQNLRLGEHVGNSSAHSNLPYGNVSNKSTAKSYYSGITGEFVGYVGKNNNGIDVYEPPDEDKGEIARSCLYMIARYHTAEADPFCDGQYTPSLTLSDAATKTTTLEPSETLSAPAEYGELSDLLDWNELDPVDDEEIRRNDLVYKGVQGNRNPFVDFPSWGRACFNQGTVNFNDISRRQVYLGEIEEEDHPSSSSSQQGSSSQSVPSSSSSSSSSSSEKQSIPGEGGLFENGTNNESSTQYSQVFSKDNLIIGSSIMLATNATNKAMGGVYKSYYRSGVDISKDGTHTNAEDGVEVVTLEKGTQDGSYSFKLSNNNYLTSSSSYNNLIETATKDGYSSFNIAFDENGIASITAVSGSNNIMGYYTQGADFACHSSSKTGYNDEMLIYTVQPTDEFSGTSPKASLSFSYDTDGFGNYCNFSNVSFYFRANYDFTTRGDYEEAGIIISKTVDAQSFLDSRSVTNTLETKGAKMVWKDYCSDTYTVKLSGIPDTAYDVDFTVAGFIKVGDIYYYSCPRTYSVISMLTKYSQSESTVIVDHEDGSSTRVAVAGLASAFLSQIGA